MLNLMRIPLNNFIASYLKILDSWLLFILHIFECIVHIVDPPYFVKSDERKAHARLFSHGTAP